MDVVLLLMVLGVMLSGFWAADALDHMRKEDVYKRQKLYISAIENRYLTGEVRRRVIYHPVSYTHL